MWTPIGLGVVFNTLYLAVWPLQHSLWQFQKWILQTAMNYVGISWPVSIDPFYGCSSFSRWRSGFRIAGRSWNAPGNGNSERTSRCSVTWQPWRWSSMTPPSNAWVPMAEEDSWLLNHCKSLFGQNGIAIETKLHKTLFWIKYMNKLSYSGVSWPSGLAYRTQVMVLAA